MTRLEQVKAVLEDMMDSLVARYPIESLAIFGSVARGDDVAGSDVDIVVEFNDRIGIGFIRLADEIEEHLGCHVDLVSRGGIKQRYWDHIKKDLVYVR